MAQHRTRSDPSLAMWTAVDNTSGTVVDDGQGNAFVHLDNTDQTLDLIDAGDNSTVHGTALVVTKGAINANDVSITWTGTVTNSDDSDYLIMSGTLGKQLMGIRGIISASNPPLLSGGLHGLTVTAAPYWVAQTFGTSGPGITDLTLKLMQQPLTAITVNTAFTAADVKFLLGNGPIVDAYQAILVAEKRFVNEMELDGGQTALTYNNKPIIIDPQCRRNTIYYINPKTMDLLTSSNGLQWADFLDGEQFKLKAGSSGYSDAYNAYLVFYGDLACKVRNGNAVLYGLNE